MLPGFPIPLVNRQLTLESSQSLPAMTSDTSPAGLISYSTHNDNGTYAAWQAFDNNGSTRWGSQYGNGFPQWIQRQTSLPITVGRLILGHSESDVIGGTGPQNFVFSGSNDGTSFTPLLTVTGETWGSGLVYKSYDIATPAAFNRHRLTVNLVSNGATFVLLHEMQLLQLL